MSNVVSNKLTLKGEKELITECLNSIKPDEDPFNNSPIDFEKIISLKSNENPEEIWGCRGNARYPEVVASAVPTTNSSIGFYTLISPPIPVITALSKQYPKIEFVLKYCDEWLGNEQIGIASFKNGLMKNSTGPELFGENKSEWFKHITELFPLTVDYMSILTDNK